MVNNIRQLSHYFFIKMESNYSITDLSERDCSDREKVTTSFNKKATLIFVFFIAVVGSSGGRTKRCLDRALGRRSE